MKQWHVDKVNQIVGKYDNPFHRDDTPKVGQSYLWCKHCEPTVDPTGPIGKMIRELGDIDPQFLPHSTTNGNGLTGLHVTANLKKGPKKKRLLVQFDKHPEVLARHPYSNWAHGKTGWELPLCMHISTALNPLPQNDPLHRYVQHKYPEAKRSARAIADVDVVITSADLALSLRGFGEVTVGYIREYFRNYPEQSAKLSTAYPNEATYAAKKKATAAAAAAAAAAAPLKLGQGANSSVIGACVSA